MSAPNVASPTLADSSIPTETTPRHVGYLETIVFLAVCQAAAAMAIDLILPAFGEIRAALDMTPDDTRVSLLISMFFVGSGLSQLAVGILSDRYGRKRVLTGGAMVYVLAALAASLAPNLAVMLVCRFVWGMASAAPRVVGTAIARDRFEGSGLAKTLSYIQAVFVVVPVLAPLGGQVIVNAFGWRAAMAAPAVIGVLLLAWLTRFPETLPVERRRVTTRAAVGSAFREVIRIRSTVMLALSVACMLGFLQSYLSLTDVITDDTYNKRSIFAAVFGAIAFVMGIAAFAHGQIVGRIGSRVVLRWSPPVLFGIGTIFLVGSVLGDGKPPFIFYCACVAALLSAQMFVFANVNSLAMQPVGHIAGLAAGLIGTQSTILGAAIGIGVSALHTEGTTALAAAAFVLTAGVVLLVQGGLRSLPRAS
jgi:MFS transporter, DHA1 family, multidrug resistance protein